MTAALQFLGIRGIIATGLAIALGFMVWRADVIAGQRDTALAALGAERANHAVTRASVSTLELELARIMAEAQKRADELAAAQQRASQAERRNARLAASTDKTIAELIELSKREGACPVPDDIRELADGL